ncbi:MAG: hypothetical protein ACK5IQ_11150 [Bacteroidales bacterium]
MEIIFRTKEEANEAQQREFLELSPAERVLAFFELLERVHRLSPRKSPVKGGQFSYCNRHIKMEGWNEARQ